MGGRYSQYPGPSPTLGSFGPSHHRRPKSRVSLRCLPYAHGALGTLHEEVRDIHHHQTESTPSSIIFIVGTQKFSIHHDLWCDIVFTLGHDPIMHLKIWDSPKDVCHGVPLATLDFFLNNLNYIGPMYFGLIWVVPPLGSPPLH